MTWVQWSAIGVLAFVLASPFLGNLLHKRRVRLNSQECRRLETLCNLADEWDNAPTDKERQRIYIKASALGFTDDSRPFNLDEPDQPHPPTGRAA